MGDFSLSEIADFVTIIGVFAAIVSAVVAYWGWRHRTGHWLYIPAPNVLSQNPAKPDFWVFPPVKLDNGNHAVVIAGTLINAGPSDAFSVRIYSQPELQWELGIEPLHAAAAVAAEHKNANEDEEAILRTFLDVYKNRRSFIPVLRVGDKQSFVVISELKRGDAYLEELLDGEGGRKMTAHWQTPERKQAHGVHAAARTIVGRRILFRPNDLCSPFEGGPAPSAWIRKASPPLKEETHR